MSKVNDQSPAVAAMAVDWDLIDALQSTRTMREAGETYLPKRTLESREDYHCRLNKATLYPALPEAVGKMVGRVFAEPIATNDDVPKWIADEVLPNVDMQGRDLHAWARDWFKEALDYGLSHVIVDSPPAEGIATLADQQRAKIRPYLVKISPRRVLGWRADGSGKLTQIRIAFTRTEPDGDFGERVVEQVKVYEIGLVRTFEKQGEGEKATWVELEPVVTGLDMIPLVTLYTSTGEMTAVPRLRELAYLNVKHWQQQSSLDALLDTASVPILVIIGANEGDDVVIGAKSAVKMPPNGKLEYCEHSGAAIGAGAQQLETLKQEMAQIGSKLLEKRETAKTATQSGEEAADQNSELGAMAKVLEDTLAQVLYVVASWRGESEGGTVKVQPNLAPDTTPAETVNTLAGMQQRGIVSDQTVFEAAKSRGMIPDEITWEEEQVRIDAQGARLPMAV